MLNGKILGCFVFLAILFFLGTSYAEDTAQWGYTYNGEPVVYEVPEQAVPLLNKSFELNAFGKQAWTDEQYDTALKAFNRALQLRIEAVGAQHPFCASVLNNIAGVYADKNNYAKAEVYYKQALEIVLEKSKPDDHDRTMIIQNLLELYHTEGKTQAALALKNVLVSSNSAYTG